MTGGGGGTRFHTYGERGIQIKRERKIPGKDEEEIGVNRRDTVFPDLCLYIFDLPPPPPHYT